MKNSLSPEALAKQLDEVLPPDQRGVKVEEPLVNVAVRLALTPPPKLSDEARQRMLKTVLKNNSPAKITPSTTRKYSIIQITRWAVVFLFVIFISGFALVPATASSVPGDILYPIKRSVEKVELFFANSPDEKAQMYLEFAEKRFLEHQIILARGSFDVELLDESVEYLSQYSEIIQQNSINSNVALSNRAMILNQSIGTVVVTSQRSQMANSEELVGLSNRVQGVSIQIEQQFVQSLPATTNPQNVVIPDTSNRSDGNNGNGIGNQVVQGANNSNDNGNASRSGNQSDGNNGNGVGNQVVQGANNSNGNGNANGLGNQSDGNNGNGVGNQVVQGANNSNGNGNANRLGNQLDGNSGNGVGNQDLAESDTDEDATLETTILLENADDDSLDIVEGQIIANQNVNVRTGPGTENRVLTTLKPDEIVEILDVNTYYGWSRVRMADGEIGWVYSNFVAIDGKPVANGNQGQGNQGQGNQGQGNQGQGNQGQGNQGQGNQGQGNQGQGNQGQGNQGQGNQGQGNQGQGNQGQGNGNQGGGKK